MSSFTNWFNKYTIKILNSDMRQTSSLIFYKLETWSYIHPKYTISCTGLQCLHYITKIIRIEIYQIDFQSPPINFAWEKRKEPHQNLFVLWQLSRGLWKDRVIISEALHKHTTVLSQQHLWYHWRNFIAHFSQSVGQKMVLERLWWKNNLLLKRKTIHFLWNYLCKNYIRHELWNMNFVTLFEVSKQLL